VQIQVAEAYVEHKIRLDRAPALVHQRVEEEENRDKYSRDSDAFEKMPRARGGDDNISFIQRRAREILIRHAIVTQQEERALALLSDFRREIEQSKLADTTGRAGNSWRNDQIEYSMLARQAGLDVSIADLSISNPEQPDRYPIAEFEAKDLSGKTWSLADLQGKVTFVLFWRTGCACNNLLDGIQNT